MWVMGVELWYDLPDSWTRATDLSLLSWDLKEEAIIVRSSVIAQEVVSDQMRIKYNEWTM